MTERKHAELPWSVDTLMDAILDKSGHELLRASDENDFTGEYLEFIVRACNSHYELVHVAEIAIQWMHHLGNGNTDASLLGAIAEDMGEINAILKKAKGETQ